MMPAADMFWGDRYGVVTDPFGHNWSFATHIKDLTPEEMQAGDEGGFRAAFVGSRDTTAARGRELADRKHSEVSG